MHHRKHRNPAVFAFVLSFVLYPVASLGGALLPEPQVRYWNVLIFDQVWWDAQAVKFGMTLSALMLGALLVRVGREIDSDAPS